MWRRLVRWLLRLVLGTVALAVAAIAAALIALHTDWGRERVRDIVVDALASSFPSGVKIGAIEGSVLGELVVRDVELKALDGSTFAKVGTLRIEAALLPLLGKTAEIDHLVAEDVELYPLKPTEPPDPTPAEPLAWSVELPSIEIRRARVVLATPSQTITLEGLDLTAQVSIPAGGGAISASSRLRGTWRERGAAFEGSLAARIGDLVEVSSVDLRIGGAAALGGAGGIALRGTDLVADAKRPLGTLHLEAPAAAVRLLAPGVELPADVALEVKSVRFTDKPGAAAGEVSVELAGRLGAARVTGKVVTDPENLRARGVLHAKGVVIEELTRGAHTGTADAIVAFEADRRRARGAVIATGRVDGFPAGDAVIGFDTAIDDLDRPARAQAVLLAAAGGGASWARGLVALSRRDGALAIDTGRLAAATRDAGALGTGVPAGGRVALSAEVGGTAEPLAATVTAAVEGDALWYGETRAERITARRLRVDLGGTVRGTPAAPQLSGEATASVRGAARAGAPLGDADLRARAFADRSLWAQVTARPAAAPITAVLSARIFPGDIPGKTPGETTVISLEEHAITMPGGERWAGRGGRITVRPDLITAERISSRNRDGRVELGATFAPATERLTVALDATAVAAASIDPSYRGTASGALRLERRGLRWDGTATLGGRGLVLAPDMSPLDADVRLKVAGRRVVLETAARTTELGGVRFDLDVDGPADLTDPDGWRLLSRAAVRSARIGVDQLNLAAAAISTGGVVDGALTIAGADTTGTMKVSGIATPLGEVAGDITFKPEDHSELGATSSVRVSDIGAADVSARIAFPRQPFDPEAWQRLGRGALSHLGASLTDVAIDPERLSRLGIALPYRGTVDVSLAVSGGGTAATVEVDVQGVSGGPIAQPLDVHLTASVDARAGTRASGYVEDTREPARTVLASFEAQVPSFSIDRWIAAPAQARYAPIVGGAVTVPGLREPGGGAPAPLPAPALLALFGRADLSRGTIAGTIEVAGTLGTPTAKAQLALSQLQVARRVPGRPAPPPTDLLVEARWGGASGRVTITGSSAGGTLSAALEGAPDDRAKVFGIITATNFDLAPLAAFLPEDFAAAEGKLRANLVARGAESLANVRGSLALSQATVPLDPMIGTLREGAATVTIDDRGVEVDVKGALGAGQVLLSARSPGHELASVEAVGTLTKVSPLGEWEPVINADVEAKLTRTTLDQWNGSMKVRRASATLPKASEDLGDPDAPLDLLFVEDGPIERPAFALGGRPPERPWLVLDIELEPMTVTAEDLFDTRGTIKGNLQLLVGEDDLGLVGSIDIETGVINDLFGRRYTATGGVVFDGTIEPKVDIELQHKFPALTLTVLLRGNPETLVPDFRSDPPTYSRDQLAGFLIGGEPSGDPSSQTREAATGAGVALLSSNLGARIRKRLPIKIEQLGCDPGNSVTSASCTVGRWFGEKLFVAFKRRIETLEAGANTNEVQGQYYLRRDLYFEMVGGDAGNGGLDLLWRRRW